MELLSLPTLEQIARFSFNCQAPVDWTSDSDRISNLEQEHEIDIRLATDLTLAEKRANLINQNIPLKSYFNQWVLIKDDLRVMLSIRFKNLDPQHPFVDISISTRPIIESDFPYLLDAARKVYPEFKAGKLRFWSLSPKEAFSSTSNDMRVLAIPIEKLKNDSAIADIKLKLSSDDYKYAEAKKAYDDIDSEFPDHKEQAQLIPKDLFDECIKEKAMFDVFYKDEWCGYVAALPEINLGFKTYTVQEIILTKDVRGLGLGKQLNLALAHQLKENNRIFLGTIHGDNRGAIESALHAGRLDLGGWHWLPQS